MARRLTTSLRGLSWSSKARHSADKIIHKGSPSQVSTAPEIFVLLLFIKNTVSAWATGTNVGDRFAMARD